MTFEIRELNESHKDWARHLLEEWWGSSKIVTRGRIHDADALPGFVAVEESRPVGLVTYRIENKECEIVSMNSLVGGKGVGSALIANVRDVATRAQCSRLWLITTNDNLAALRFYQKRGFVLAAVHRNALQESRKLKPTIPMVGLDGIPLRDEIELEILLRG
ncbi:MAG: GNAT family N-acetyltransferase [Candidatus Eisenbacteria bacterium]|nr:GNAT family N-acetyltransferase [Candidatus Eisenbacteria bacterium]